MKQGYAKVVGIAAGAVMLAMTSSLAWADSGYNWSRGHALRGSGHGVHGHGRVAHSSADRLSWHKETLSLTEDQAAKLKELALNQDLARIRAHADVMLAAREVRSLVRDEKADLSAIEAKVNEQELLEGKLKMIGIKARREAYAVLTPEQRDKLKALREKMRHGYRSHMMKTEANGLPQDGVSSGTETLGAGSQESATVDRAG